MILVPTTYVIPRGIHIIISIFLGLYFARDYRINNSVILATLLALFICAVSLLVGVVNSNVILQSIPLYLIWPIIFTILAQFHINKVTLDKFGWVVISSTLLGSILVAIGVITTLVYGKLYFFTEIFPVQIGFVNGLPKFGTQFLPILSFTIPFVIFHSINKNGFSRSMHILIFFYLVAFSILSGRSVFLLTFFVTIMFIIMHFFIFAKLYERRFILKFNFLLVVLTIIAVLLFSDELVKIFDIFVKKLLGNNDETLNSSRRFEQFTNLLATIAISPWLGGGINAPETPGSSVVAFELTYMQLMQNFGILGFSVIFAINCYFLVRVINYSMSRHLLNQVAPWIYGYLSFMIAAATNPILLKFDRLWILWIPIALYKNRKNIIRHVS